jgi:hypothetical protein
VVGPADGLLVFSDGEAIPTVAQVKRARARAPQERAPAPEPLRLLLLHRRVRD